MPKTRKNGQKTKNLTICKSRYALCTSAPCKTIKNKPGKTSCKCTVENGYNFATKSCNRLKCHKMKNGTRRIYSTFSINEMNDGKRITCVVDPKNSKKAICECTLRKSNKDWFTMGANNHKKFCGKSKWSGANKTDFYNTRKFWNSYFDKKTHKDGKMIGNPKNFINKLH